MNALPLQLVLLGADPRIAFLGPKGAAVHVREPVDMHAVAITGSGPGPLAAIAGAMLLIAVLGALLAFAQSCLLLSAERKVVAALGLDLYRRVQRLSHAYQDRGRFGDLLSAPSAAARTTRVPPLGRARRAGVDPRPASHRGSRAIAFGRRRPAGDGARGGRSSSR